MWQHKWLFRRGGRKKDQRHYRNISFDGMEIFSRDAIEYVIASLNRTPKVPVCFKVMQNTRGALYIDDTDEFRSVQRLNL